MKALYKYPQAEFPYRQLVEENGRRGRASPSSSSSTPGVFDHNRYFDVTRNMPKADPDDVAIRSPSANRGPEPATLHLLPTLWFPKRMELGPPR